MARMTDSGRRADFATGAVRDTDDGKPRLDLINPIFLFRFGVWMQQGAEKYDPRNWEIGIPAERYVASGDRHWNAYKLGERGKEFEDHLSGMAFNVMGLMHLEHQIDRGFLPEELFHLPNYLTGENLAGTVRHI